MANSYWFKDWTKEQRIDFIKEMTDYVLKNNQFAYYALWRSSAKMSIDPNETFDAWESIASNDEQFASLLCDFAICVIRKI